MKKLLNSFSFAWQGLIYVIKNERNFKIHLLALTVVCTLGFYLSIETSEWVAILLVSSLVLCLEIINTSIEKICDRIEPNQDERIKIIKDTAAAAVFLAAAFAIIIGLIVFVPYFFTQG